MLTTYRYERKPGTPRPVRTYRAARRNAVLRPPKPKKATTWRGVATKDHGFAGAIRLNRSPRWDGVPLTKPYR